MDAITADDTRPATADPKATEPYRRVETLNPALRRYVESVTRIVNTASATDVPGLVEREMASLMMERQLLRPDQRASDQNSYRRHLLFADPRGRFTVMALVWEPDQRTCIHGHNAWGAVGIYEGRLCSTGYRLIGDDTNRLERIGETEFGPGAVCSLQPDPEGIHRLHNRSYRLAVTLHTYGMDLADEPSAINRIYAE